MKFLKILILLGLSLLDIRVQAKEIITLTNAHKLVQEPENCIQAEGVCALQTGLAEKYKLKLESAVIFLNEKTAVVRQSETSLTLLSGSIWVSASSAVTIQSEYGSVKTEAGQFWVTHEAKKIVVESIDSEIILKPRMSSSDLSLRPGEQNWIGPIDESSVSSTGIPLPIEAPQLLLRWAKLYPGTKTSFETEFKSFLKTWRESVESLARHHEELASRRVASINEENARAAKLKKQHQQEDLRIRKWFRERELLN